MFTCEMSHCDDLATHEVVVDLSDTLILENEVLEVCSDCAKSWESETNVVSVMKFAGIK